MLRSFSLQLPVIVVWIFVWIFVSPCEAQTNSEALAAIPATTEAAWFRAIHAARLPVPEGPISQFTVEYQELTINGKTTASIQSNRNPYHHEWYLRELELDWFTWPSRALPQLNGRPYPPQHWWLAGEPRNSKSGQTEAWREPLVDWPSVIEGYRLISWYELQNLAAKSRTEQGTMQRLKLAATLASFRLGSFSLRLIEDVSLRELIEDEKHVRLFLVASLLSHSLDSKSIGPEAEFEHCRALLSGKTTQLSPNLGSLLSVLLLADIHGLYTDDFAQLIYAHQELDAFFRAKEGEHRFGWKGRARCLEELAFLRLAILPEGDLTNSAELLGEQISASKNIRVRFLVELLQGEVLDANQLGIQQSEYHRLICGVWERLHSIGKLQLADKLYQEITSTGLWNTNPIQRLAKLDESDADSVARHYVAALLKSDRPALMQLSLIDQTDLLCTSPGYCPQLFDDWFKTSRNRRSGSFLDRLAASLSTEAIVNEPTIKNIRFRSPCIGPPFEIWLVKTNENRWRATYGVFPAQLGPTLVRITRDGNAHAARAFLASLKPPVMWRELAESVVRPIDGPVSVMLNHIDLRTDEAVWLMVHALNCQFTGDVESREAMLRFRKQLLGEGEIAQGGLVNRAVESLRLYSLVVQNDWQEVYQFVADDLRRNAAKSLSPTAPTTPTAEQINAMLLVRSAVQHSSTSVRLPDAGWTESVKEFTAQDPFGEQQLLAQAHMHLLLGSEVNLVSTLERGLKRDEEPKESWSSLYFWECLTGDLTTAFRIGISERFQRERELLKRYHMVTKTNYGDMVSVRSPGLGFALACIALKLEHPLMAARLVGQGVHTSHATSPALIWGWILVLLGEEELGSDLLNEVQSENPNSSIARLAEEILSQNKK